MNENNKQNKDLEFARKLLEWAIDDETDLDYLREIRWCLIDIIDYRVAKSSLMTKENEISVDKLLDRIIIRTQERKAREKQRER